MTQAPGTTPVDLPLHLRVELTHAAVQAIADRHDLDLLHVKGPALDASLAFEGRRSTDADVLVRPSHVHAFLRVLGEHGFRLVTGFASGSVFEHAANHHSEAWGYCDVHRSFPGVGVDPEEAFELLWADRVGLQLAHRPCAAPSVLDQALLLTLHGARGEGSDRSLSDIDRAFTSAGSERQTALRERAHRLGADLALAAAIGELDRHRDDPRHDLWAFYSHGGTRAQEWRARLRATQGTRAKARLLTRGLGVNREYLAMTLGHDPSRREVVRAVARRYATALTQLRPRRGQEPT